MLLGAPRFEARSVANLIPADQVSTLPEGATAAQAEAARSGLLPPIRAADGALTVHHIKDLLTRSGHPRRADPRGPDRALRGSA